MSERFVLQKLLGRGAFGAVYRALDTRRDALVAIKFLTSLDPSALFQFKAEFRTLANLAHPNLLQLYELVSHGDDWLLVMELVEGSDFYDWVRPRAARPVEGGEDDEDDEDEATVIESMPTAARALRPSQAVAEQRSDAPALFLQARGFHEPRLRAGLLQLAEGLHALHCGNRLHRDLKPANVLVSHRDGRVLICDFGLALEGSGQRSGSDDKPAAPGNGQFESRRELAGTLAFMSPEQAMCETLTAASDWYAVGVILYQALTGYLPISSKLPYPEAVLAKQRAGYVHPSQLVSDVPHDLAQLALALLAPDPSQRAGYADVAKVLAASATQRVHAARGTSVLVGRESQLELLASSFRESRSGSPVVALLAGTSGMGKSALTAHFLAQLEHDEGALVLRGRCYEREALPYKALDPLVDALSSHLLDLPAESVEALVPASISSLAELFPSLNRVPAIANAGASREHLTDPRARRVLAFRAFRQLCKNLSRERPLVLYIDDLQWGDLDSAPMLQELFSSPGAPRMLVVCAYRKEDERNTQLLSVLRELHANDPDSLRLVDVAVDALAEADAVRLSRALLHADYQGAAEVIAREAEGSPFFVGELAAYVNEHGVAAASKIQLSTLIAAQLGGLSQASRQLLSTIALAGRPIAASVVQRASQLSEGGLRAFRDLATRRLVLSTREGEVERVECYHDRIREAAAQGLAGEAARTLHRALAEALEQEAGDDYDALLDHWRGAGERERAGEYAVRGAERAEAALAFTRAAALYREALALLGDAHAKTPLDESRSRALHERLGHALIFAGRGSDAAAVFVDLLPGATRAEALTLRTLATTQLLRGGKLVEGFRQLERADDLFGVRFPVSLLQAFLMLLVRRVRILFAERALRIHESAALDDPRGARLEAMWEVAAAVSSADFIRGNVYGAELMLRALRLGAPSHIAGACGMEAISAAASNDEERTERMIAVASDAAERSGELHVLGRGKGMQAICRQLQGRWLESIRLARESQEVQRQSGRLIWDSAIVLWWEMTSASSAGQVSELVTRVPEALRDADARGDVFAATSFRTHRNCWAWLGIDRPELADQQVDIAEREWTPRGYQFQHWHMTLSRADIALYSATPKGAFERVSREWARGRLLRVVKAVHADMLYARARLALALLHEAPRKGLLERAVSDARALQRLNMPWTIALGTLVRACAAARESPSRALALYADAERHLQAADMVLHAQVARVRQGELLAGDEGREQVAKALSTIQQLGVRRPERFVRMLAPDPRGAR